MARDLDRVFVHWFKADGTDDSRIVDVVDICQSGGHFGVLGMLGLMMMAIGCFLWSDVVRLWVVFGKKESER